MYRICTLAIPAADLNSGARYLEPASSPTLEM